MIFSKLFFTFFKIGLFTFGGGYAMLPLIQSEVVKNAWVTEKQIVDFIAVSESTPGPFAINISTYIGNVQSGILGGFCATMGVVVPSFVIILLVARFYEAFKDNRYVKGCMTGLRPCVVGLIGSALVSVFKTVFFGDGVSVAVLQNPAIYVSLVIFTLSTILAFKKIHPILIILMAAAIGIFAGYLL